MTNNVRSSAQPGALTLTWHCSAGSSADPFVVGAYPARMPGTSAAALPQSAAEVLSNLAAV